MTAAMAKRKFVGPYKGWRATAKVHERMAADLPINSKVAIAIVDDPYSDCGERIQVIRSVRNDPLAAMFSRKEIDQAQHDAGRLYEEYAEQAEIGNVKAIDPSKEAVDGGRFAEPVSDHYIAAVRHLSEAAKVLGLRGEWLTRAVLIQRKTFAEVAPGLSEREKARLRSRFFECLEDLAGLWGCKS